MTKEEFAKIIETDPRFNLNGKAITVTFFDLPMKIEYPEDPEDESVTITIDDDSVTLTYEELDAFREDHEFIGACISNAVTKVILKAYLGTISGSTNVYIKQMVPGGGMLSFEQVGPIG